MVIKNEMEDEKNKKMLIYFFITSTCKDVSIYSLIKQDRYEIKDTPLVFEV
jgi:hypothetical protein